MEKAEDSIRAINCRKSSLDPSPLISSILGNRGVGMLKPGVSYKPKVGPHVWGSVPEENSEEAVVQG